MTILPGLTAFTVIPSLANSKEAAASLELAKDGITVNAVSPGNIVTDSLMSLYGEDGHLHHIKTSNYQ